MRADRLISIVMLLQTRQRMTANELSAELEVSERTIYRDINSLSMAGIPIYTDRGPGGGIALVESYRTTLTGMNEDEAQALFMMSIPQALVDLGVSQKLKQALLKLAAALPSSQKKVKAQTQQRIFIDSTGWNPPDGHVPHLAVLHQATWQDQRVRIVFRGSFEAKIVQEADPLGLVSKMNSWYLVGLADGHLRVFKVADILEAEILADRFTRDEGFNLAEFWANWCADSVKRRSLYPVQLKISPGLTAKLRNYLDEGIDYVISEGDGDLEGWNEVTINFDNFFQARQSVLSFGRAAGVIEPEVLKISVIDFARQIVDFYQEKQLV